MQILKETIRTKILFYSQESFLKDGYRKTSLENIAIKCGISKSNIYNYFKTKDEIFNELVKPAKDNIMEISYFLENNSFIGSDSLQTGILFILDTYIVPIREAVILIYDREVEENRQDEVFYLLNIIEGMAVPGLTIPDNKNVLHIVAENLLKGYIDILKLDVSKSQMTYQLRALTEYHVGGLSYLKGE